MRITPRIPRLLFLATLSIVSLSTLSATHLRVYMLGNSLTDDVRYDGFQNIVSAAGHSLALGSQRVPGAPIHYLWENPTGGFTHSPYGTYPNAFANYQWDAITLQPTSTGYAAQLSTGASFARALRGDGTFGPPLATTPGPEDPTGISPDAIVYVYAQQPPNLLAGWNVDYWLNGSASEYKTRAYFDQYFLQLQDAEPQTTFRYIPTGHVFHELHMRMRAGRVPGISHQSDWLIDNSHSNTRGSYVIALTFFATIYGEDPRGQAPVQPYQVTQALADVIQDAVWTVASRHPWTGLATQIIVTDASLPDPVENEPYAYQLSTALEEGAVTWSIASGALPTGLQLSSSGILSGTTPEVGIFDVTIRAEDASGKFDERPFILFALSSAPPIITTGVLPQGRIGKPYEYRLEHENGVGDMQWTLLQGDLPRGLTLTPSGIITGTPTSVPGSYKVTVAVRDSAGSEGTISLGLLLGSAENETLIAAPVHAPPTLDGVLAEPAWDLTLPIDSGAGSASPRFAMCWDEEALYVAIDIVDGGARNPNDAAHIFLDGFHSKQLALNADDRHIVIHPDGSWEERNGRPADIAIATHETTQGWTIEAKIPFSNIERTVDKQSFTLGFDVAVTQQAGGSGSVTYSLFGTSTSNPIPADMGDLVLHLAPLTANLLVNGDFSENLQSLSYPGEASTEMAGEGWKVDGVPSRTFASLDGTGYGYPDRAIVANGNAARTAFQVIHDNRQTKGEGFLRFDIKLASPGIAYRLYGYNGGAATVDARMGVQTASHPASGGSPDATLLQGTLSGIPSESSWREVALPVDFAEGYDYLILTFGAAISGVDLDARIDNVELGSTLPLHLVSGADPSLPESIDTLFFTDFRGTNPSSNLPWVAVHTQHDAINFSGIQAGPGIVIETGDNGLYYSQNHGATVSTLSHALSNNQYLHFTVSVDEGTLDLAGGVLQFAIDRMGNSQASGRIALFSSVDGFQSPDDAIFISSEIARSAMEPYAVALPTDPAYKDLNSITFRLYAFAGQYTRKTMGLVNLALGGVVTEPAGPDLETTYAAWSAGFDWKGKDASMQGDASGDGIPNLLAFALDLPDPTVPAPRELLPTFELDSSNPGQTHLRFRFRRTTNDAGLRTLPESSSDLESWLPLGNGTLLQVIDPDPDGDGSAQLWEAAVPIFPPEPLFIRLNIGPEE